MLHERRQAGGWRSQAFLQAWQLQRREYVQLYQQHLSSLKAGRMAIQVGLFELAKALLQSLLNEPTLSL